MLEPHQEKALTAVSFGAVDPWVSAAVTGQKIVLFTGA
jgi:hypothetical protein